MDSNHRGGGDTPLLGRADVLDQLRTMFEHGEHLLLLGRSGIGKTRLAHALLDTTPTPRVERIFTSPVTRDDRLGSLASIGFPSGIDANDLGSMFQWYLSRCRRL